MKYIIVTAFILSSFGLILAQKNHNNNSDLLNKLTGPWQMTGHVMKKPVEYKAEGKWILNDQFFRFAMVDVNTPPQYEAQIFFGYDSAKTGYVVHWLDVFGGEYSKILGFGKVAADTIQILFKFGNRPFRDIISLNKKQNTGQFLIEYKNAEGNWKEFARYKMVRLEK